MTQLVLHVLLNATEHEGLQDRVQALQLLLVQRALLLRVRLDVLGEPLLELLVRVEQLGHDEVQQRPQLGHRVLDGRSREQQPVPAVERQQRLFTWGLEII